MAVKLTSLEVLVYEALLAVGWEKEQIDIQTPILGGRRTKGGQVVDFVLYRPQPTPIYCNGDYWHQDDEQEAVETMDALNYFGTMPVVIWGHEATDMKQAIAVVRKKVGSP